MLLDIWNSRGDLHQDYKCSADLYVPDSVGGFPMGTGNWEGEKWI